MPDIWDDTKFLTTCDEVLGALADWAVQQSPYVCPDNLQQALEEFARELPFDRESPAGCIFETSCQWLHKMVRDLIDACPSILAWNKPKLGQHMVVFTSRYDRPNPDYDFIDLDALARNVAHSVTITNKYDQAQNRMYVDQEEAARGEV
jgi:hypothetical protein